MSYTFDAPPPSDNNRGKQGGWVQDENSVSRAFISKPNPNSPSGPRAGDIFVGHLLDAYDETESLGYRINGHYRRSVNRWQPCRACTERAPNGDACAYVQSEIKRLTGSRGYDGKPITPGKAWALAKATPNVLFPFYAWKASQDKPDDFRMLGSVGLEMDGTLETLFKDKARSILRSCASCGGEDTMRHVGWFCKQCDKEVSWLDEDRKARVNPTCSNCKCRVPVRQSMKCSEHECGGTEAQDPCSGLWKIWSKRVRGDDGKEKNVWNIRFNHKKPMPDNIKPYRKPMKTLIEYCPDFETVGRQDEPEPNLDSQNSSRSPGGSFDKDDSIPF